MSRTEFSAKTKAQAAMRANGHCEKCTARLASGQFHYDHIVPDAIGGKNDLENCMVLCRNCHGEKTAKRDVPAIAKAKRGYRKHVGADKKRSTFAGSRQSRLKKCMDGSVVDRATGRPLSRIHRKG